MKMATLTIRNLDDSLKERLRVHAAANGRSMTEEARLILRHAIGGISGPELWALSRQLFKDENGIDLQIPQRNPDQAF
jgi:plasmid stability protein